MFEHDSELCEPFVRETQYKKSLHFSPFEMQSEMLKRDPDTLLADYTRTMMGFLMFDDAPNRIAMVGLGGGSLAKFCYRELPRSRIDVVEINPHVVALREEFHVPPDNERFRVHLDDGARFIAQSVGQFDVLLVDAYNRKGMPVRLTTQAFYDTCRHALRCNGILVTNLFCEDSDAHVDRIRQSFGSSVFWVDEPVTTNRVVFAIAGDVIERLQSPVIGRSAHLRQATRLLLKPTFSRVASALLMQCHA